MSKGTLNKVMIIGNLGKDPETTCLPSGLQITKLSLATCENWKDKKTDEILNHTEWHRVVMYGKLAEIAAKFLTKGSKIYIEGKLKTTKYQDKNTGQDRYSTDIIADKLEMLGSKNSDQKENKNQDKYQQEQDQFNDDLPF